MKRIWLVVFLVGTLLGQPQVESQVLSKIQEMILEGGPINFSDLYNHSDFNAREREFLGRLYEVFFAIPGYLKTEYEATGNIPTIEEIAASFSLSRQSAQLLLAVMEADPRVPELFDRGESGEISALNLQQIDQFIERRGTQVRMTWAGEKLPDFSLETFDGNILNRESLRGKNVLLYFWFTGCPPCVRQAPILADLHATFASSNLELVGLCADELLEIGTTPESRRTYVEKQGLNFTHATLNRETRDAFGGINVYPTLLLVSADGIILRQMVNFQEQVVLENAIQELLGSTEP
ncbi:MAG TPA: TlpA disulfide reductase family protein [Acidobacteriota bacterium]|nr:TlpA disulfide reductase family protein [Acidobacteriota bacterium]